MKLRRFIVTLGLVVAGTALTGTGILAQGYRFDDSNRSKKQEQVTETCQPGLDDAIRRYPVYRRLHRLLASDEELLQLLLEDVNNQASYAALLSEARSLISALDDGRLVITLADGTVVLDTAGADDAANARPTGNSYQHFTNKTVNENHNTRVAIFSAQLYPCGVGVESKLSTTTGNTESYVAIRLGKHLNSVGTARLSTVN